MIRRKILGLITLFRPELPFAAGVSVLMGEMIAVGGLPSAREALLGFLCVFMLSGSALILNDVFDLEVDRVNAPWRPLPSGMVSITETIGFSIPVTLIGFFAALAINPFTLVMSIIIWIIGFLYNWRFKRSGLPGNLMVSTSVSATFILGGMAVGQPWNKIVWFFATVAFLIDLAEEIAGDAMDMEGDQLLASRSLALQFGRTLALRISTVIFATVLFLTFVPLVLKWLGVRYIPAMIVMDIGLIFFTFRLVRSQNSKEGVAAMRGIYLCMLAGMLVYILGQFFI